MVVAGFALSASGQPQPSVADLQAQALQQAEPRVQGAHNTHPYAQWFPDAGLGLFIHWGIASVDASLQQLERLGDKGYYY